MAVGICGLKVQITYFDPSRGASGLRGSDFWHRAPFFLKRGGSYAKGQKQKNDQRQLRFLALDGVPVCVRYDADGTEFLYVGESRYRQKNGRPNKYSSKRSHRTSRQEQRGALLDDHTLRN